MCYTCVQTRTAVITTTSTTKKATGSWPTNRVWTARASTGCWCVTWGCARFRRPSDRIARYRSRRTNVARPYRARKVCGVAAKREKRPYTLISHHLVGPYVTVPVHLLTSSTTMPTTTTTTTTTTSTTTEVGWRDDYGCVMTEGGRFFPDGAQVRAIPSHSAASQLYWTRVFAHVGQYARVDSFLK